VKGNFFLFKAQRPNEHAHEAKLLVGALLEKFEDLIVLSPIEDVYLKNSKEDMLDTAFSEPFCRNYYTIQMLRFVIFTTIIFGLQNSSWAQIILSLGMAIIICGLTIKFQRMGY
jgi:hypothetical protein